jgi:fructose-bisphosphate aldolase class 1
MARIRSSAASKSLAISFTHALFEQGVTLEAILLKPNRVLADKNRSRQASVPEVATATLRCLRRYVPVACLASFSCRAVKALA